ncbi:hypothetical protein ACKXGF_05170 [Alkalibacillus sp. S2W]|uniref:hypothetical protein n=1 Tax=Alkalibacillus sp. S2W TaxID=3386553 RepID=UPI00398CDFE9
MYINSLNKTNYIKNVDTGSSIHLTVSDYDESLVDLTSYDSVEVIIGDDTGRLREINPTLESDTGELSFDFTSDDLLPEGEYYLEVHLIESDGSIRVAPSERKFYMHVTKSLDEVGDMVNVITIQEFEQRIQDAETTANDAATYANNQGDYAKQEADRLVGTDVSQLDTELTNHKDNTSNPHSVTKSQVGLGNVDNVQQASKNDFDDLVARVGNNENLNTNEKSKIILALNEVNNKADDIASNLTAHKAELTNHKDNTSNPHSVTKSQVGLGNVDDVQQAAKTNFDSHVSKTATDGAHGMGSVASKDYEEGGWSPKFEGSDVAGSTTYNRNDGRYIKIGNMVHVMFDIYINTLDSNIAGDLNITGLPFLNGGMRNAVSLERFARISLASNMTTISGEIRENENHIRLYFSGDNQYNQRVAASDISSTTLIAGFATYSIW